jgi:maltose O-acetyltransferase
VGEPLNPKPRAHSPLGRAWRAARKLLRRARLRARLYTLRFHSARHLARIGEQHPREAVRHRAWVLSGSFVAGEGTHFNRHVTVVVDHWGQLAATLGERVALAPGVTFVAASSPCHSRLVELEGFAERYVKYAPITVGDDAWLGAGAIVLPGVTVGKCAVVGAGAVVTRDVPDYAVAAGVPARVVGDVRDAGKPT